jgi:hypothetical protein
MPILTIIYCLDHEDSEIEGFECVGCGQELCFCECPGVREIKD